MYTASQKLIDILLKNGFKNKSYLYVQDYGEKFSSKFPYDPGTYKRVFGLGDGKRRLEFYFDYITMAVIERGAFITSEYYEFDEGKLRSIIAYFKCSYHKQKTLRECCGNKIELSGNVLKEYKERGHLKSPFDKKFERIYNCVKL